MSRLDVSIIIVNYNTRVLTCNCIHSILSNVHSCFYEIIVVDNNSSDGSATALRSEFGDKITVIESKTNLGFGRANNAGSANAKGEFLFFLNSDTILVNDPFLYFLPAYGQLHACGAIGAYLMDGNRQYSPSGGKIYSAKKYLRIGINGLLRMTSAIEIPLSDKAVKAGYVIGADLFLKKELFNEIGGFDPKIFMYFEDVRLCDQIQKRGLINYLIPGPEIIHFVKSSSSSQFSRVHNTASLMYCMRDKLGTVRFRMFQLAYLLLKAPLLLNFKNFKNELQYVGSIISYRQYLVK